MSQLDDILNHRRSIERQIQQSFGYDLEKGQNVGDITVAPDGKQYVWTEYAPGKFDWRVYNKTHIIKGKGINGKHGISALREEFQTIDKSYTDDSKISLKRTPNGHWRLYYDNADIGHTIDGDTITSQELEQDGVMYHANQVVDNFDLVEDYMEFNSPDDVYFVQIIKRWKDNKDKPGADSWKAKGKQQGSYHSGAEYLSYYLIHSASELKTLKPQIVKQCVSNNARAYITINSRNEAQTTAYMQKFVQRFNDPNDPRVKNAEAILYGMPKTGPAWRNERFKVLVDVDTTRDAKVKLPNGQTVNIWKETEKRLDDLGIKVAAKYETPSGGLHLILNNKNNRNLSSFYKGLTDFDGGRDLGKLATVHPSEDVKMVLYSNVATPGY